MKLTPERLYYQHFSDTSSVEAKETSDVFGDGGDQGPYGRWVEGPERANLKKAYYAAADGELVQANGFKYTPEKAWLAICSYGLVFKVDPEAFSFEQFQIIEKSRSSSYWAYGSLDEVEDIEKYSSEQLEAISLSLGDDSRNYPGVEYGTSISAKEMYAAMEVKIRQNQAVRRIDLDFDRANRAMELFMTSSSDNDIRLSRLKQDLRGVNLDVGSVGLFEALGRGADYLRFVEEKDVLLAFIQKEGLGYLLKEKEAEVEEEVEAEEEIEEEIEEDLTAIERDGSGWAIRFADGRLWVPYRKLQMKICKSRSPGEDLIWEFHRQGGLDGDVGDFE